MTRRSLRTALADKIGVDLADNDGIVIELRHIPQKPGLQTVRIIPAKELSALLDELVSTESREAVHRAQERAHRAENEVRALQLAAAKEREMRSVNVAATEHPGNTVAERGETVSLHGLLENWTKENHWGGDDEFDSYSVSKSGLRTIEAAIREDAIAPWRERVAALEKELDELQMWVLADTQEWTQKYDALKARADALRAGGVKK